MINLNFVIRVSSNFAPERVNLFHTVIPNTHNPNHSRQVVSVGEGFGFLLYLEVFIFAEAATISISCMAVTHPARATQIDETFLLWYTPYTPIGIQ